jgi:penicillin-binding protein 1C
MPERVVQRMNDHALLQSKPRGSVFTPQIAYIITDIIADNQARSPAFGEYSPLNLPFFCAVKTGTSKDFRDNWCIGFTDEYLVGVWVGNFNGSPMHKVSGITGAAPIFRDIMLMLHRDEAGRKPMPPDGLVYRTICSISGKLAASGCGNCMEEMFIPGNEPVTMCPGHDPRSMPDLSRSDQEEQYGDFMIAFPDDRDIFKIDPVLRVEHQRLRLRIWSGHTLTRVTWYVDDKDIGTAGHPFSILWNLMPGTHIIVAQGVTGDGATIHTRPVTITVLK